ncbi:holo-ACP synthase [Candidatus Soleaferrea massiliensis]|uniref:holo-ACP synthase n=1 Tax=Candidatus Soleaferrea massiliensis TaxID=1470354 RepID=UPI0018CFE2C3|nr:holo-ACP synthase [Candidatus Soleaferrea massiliensis]
MYGKNNSICGVGVDMVEIERIAKSMENPRFLTRVFSIEEQSYFESRSFPIQTIAAGFAAKEAFSKAIGTGVRGFSLQDVSVRHDALGKPILAFSGPLAQRVREEGWHFELSLSHCREYAVAFVVASKLQEQIAKLSDGETPNQNRCPETKCSEEYL